MFAIFILEESRHSIQKSEPPTEGMCEDVTRFIEQNTLIWTKHLNIIAVDKTELVNPGPNYHDINALPTLGLH